MSVFSGIFLDCHLRLISTEYVMFDRFSHPSNFSVPKIPSVVLTLLLTGVPLLAQPVESHPKQPASVSSLKILDSLEVDLGDRSIFYNRIEPPVLKSWVKPKPAPAEATVIYVQTAEELAEEKRLAALRYEWLNLEAAVYVGRGSEVRMSTEEGEVVALSSIDFRHLEMLFHFEDEGVFYSAFCFQYSWTREELAEWRREDPTAAWPLEHKAFPVEVGGMSRFEVISAPRGKAGEAAIEGLEALHAYHDANRKALVAAFAEREKARLVYEQEEAERKANPPAPKDTVINYFPIRSVYATQSEGVEVRK